MVRRRTLSFGEFPDVGRPTFSYAIRGDCRRAGSGPDGARDGAGRTVRAGGGAGAISCRASRWDGAQRQRDQLPRGALVVTLDAPVGSYAAADCPYGWFCFYDLPNFGYPRGKLSSCGWQNLANWSWQFRVESAHYNLDSGYVAFHYQQSQELFRVSTVNRVRSDATPTATGPPTSTGTARDRFRAVHRQRVSVVSVRVLRR